MTILPDVVKLVVPVIVWRPVQVLVVPLLLRSSRANNGMRPKGGIACG